MTICKLAEVRVRLEKAVHDTKEKPPDVQDEYDRHEMLAIQILDSEHMNYPDGLLEEYLMCYLRLKRIELGVDD
jgi:hypothetical protein